MPTARVSEAETAKEQKPVSEPHTTSADRFLDLHISLVTQISISPRHPHLTSSQSPFEPNYRQDLFVRNGLSFVVHSILPIQALSTGLSGRSLVHFFVESAFQS